MLNKCNGYSKKKQIIKIISTVLNTPVKNLKDNLKLGDLVQWDSLAQINIYLKLKKKYKKDVSLEKLSKTKSVKEWVNLFS